MKNLLAIVLIALMTTAHASDETCQKLARKVAKLKGGDPTVYGTPLCKTMPDDTGKTIMILGDELMVVGTDSGEVFSRGPCGTTPPGSTPSSIDTAPYWLTPTMRGFGVRFYAEYPHYHAGEGHQTLNMYVVEGEKIRPVMELLIVKLEVSVEECKDGSNEEDCTQSVQTDERTISVAKTRHNGYADLIVKTHGSHDKVVLTYDANHYVGPLDAMEDPVNPSQ